VQVLHRTWRSWRPGRRRHQRGARRPLAGSHLEVAVVVDGAISSWSLVHDSSANRREYGLATPEPLIS
jgi:hypothetical protein